MPDEVPPWSGPCQILSLDGGGIRGLFSAAVLSKLEEDLGVTVIDHFDLIVGTSTGGIIAVALGMGLRPADIVEFYVRKGPEIFSRPSGWIAKCWHSVKRLRKSKYDNAALEIALRGVFGDHVLGDSQKRLVIVSYNLGRDEIRLFKTPHHPRLERDWRLPAWEVAMATAAAPTYFPAWRGIDDMRLIDGGVWANNPTMVGIVEAKSILGVALEQMQVLSLGTCDDVVSRPDVLDNGGLLTWCGGSIEVILRGQSVGTDNLAALLIGRERVSRIDPKVPQSLFSLDDTTSIDKLLAEAAHASMHFSPTFTEKFASHKGIKYTPLRSAGRGGS